mgnify:CR=1 FL=1
MLISEINFTDKDKVDAASKQKKEFASAGTQTDSPKVSEFGP